MRSLAQVLLGTALSMRVFAAHVVLAADDDRLKEVEGGIRQPASIRLSEYGERSVNAQAQPDTSQPMPGASLKRTADPKPLVDTVVQTLQSCPAWCDSKADNDAIIARLRPLSGLSTSVLRAGIGQFVALCEAKNNYGVANMSKPFLLNRLLFSVPDKATPGNLSFGGWECFPLGAGPATPLWPLAFGADHQVHLTGKFGGYSGPPCLAVQEFDYFLRRYGRRQPPPGGIQNPGRAANRGQSVRPETNQTSAAARSNR